MYKQNIDTILLKYFKGNATPEEEIFLEDWISNNQQEYVDAVKVFFSNLEQTNQLDTNLAYQKFIKKINEVNVIPITKHSIFSKILKYTAIFVVLITCSFLLYQTIYKQDLVFSKKRTTAFEKATLVLADGTEVVLEEHQNEEIKSDAGVKIINTNKVLKFSSQKNTVIVDQNKLTYNTLYVPIGEIYELELPDGSRVWLNSATSFRFPTQFVGKERIVFVEDGEAFFEVQKDKNKPFIVKNQTAEVKVLGTNFNVTAYSDDTFFAVTLLEGSVQMSSSNPEIANAILKPGQKGNLIKGGKSPIGIKELDPYQDIAWKDGKFYFEQEKLGAITAKLSRWYNVDFNFEDPLIANYIFTGMAKKEQSIEYLLNIISKTSNVKYEVIRNTKNNKKMIRLKKKY